MLVLSRKVDEEICIGEGICIKVLGIRRGSVRIGIVAPADLKILRRELELPGAESAPREANPAMDRAVPPRSPIAAGKPGPQPQPRAELGRCPTSRMSPLACFTARKVGAVSAGSVATKLL